MIEDSAIPVPGSDVARQDALHGVAMEKRKDLGTHARLLQQTELKEALLSF